MRKRYLLFVLLLIVSCDGGHSSSNSSASNSSSISNSISSTHQVTFINGQEVIKIVTVPHGGTASYIGEIPTKVHTDSTYQYDFIGWDSSLNNIQNDLIVNATYQVIKNEEIEVDDYIYRPIYDEAISSLVGYEVRFYNDMDFDGDLYIPTTYDNLPILRIGEACFMDCLMKNVTIPNTVKVIDAYAFNSCENIEKLEFPDSCKVLYNAAVYYDNNLTEINLNNIEFIGIDNFHICPKLLTISVSDNNVNFSSKQGVLYNKDLSTLIKVPENMSSVTIENVTTGLYEEALSRLNAIDTIVLPSSITILPMKAFFESKVKHIEIKGDIKVIEPRTFSHCVKLESIVLPNGLVKIKDHAFYHCESLTTINLSDTIESIDDFAFAYCYKLESFYIPASLKNLGYGALDEQDSLLKFEVSSENKSFKSYNSCLYSFDLKTLIRVPQTLADIEFSNEIVTIGSGAFYKCQEFTSLTLPETITSIESFAFYFMNRIYQLNIPDSVVTIEEGAFENMEELIYIHLPNQLTVIEKSLFENCPLLQEVNIPYGVTEIKDNVFYNCINLPVLTLSKNVKSFGKDTFAACNMLDTIYYEGSQSDWNKIANRDISGLTSETEVIFNHEM